MKKGKKLFSLLLAAVLALGLSVTAFAEEGTATDNGSITVENATIGQKYTAYKVFDLTYVAKYTEATYTEGSTETYYTYDETDGVYTEVKDPGTATEQLYVKGYNVSYTYTKAGDTDALYTALTGTDSPFTLTASTKENVYNVSTSSDAATIASFLKDLVDKGTLTTTITAITPAQDSQEVKFENLDYGYYYITSTLGTLVTIDSTLPDVTVKDKNAAPTAETKVQEDSKENDDGGWGATNTADLGQTVNFQTTITAYAGAEGYVLHDTMGDGFTFGDADSVSVTETVGETTKTLTAYVDDNTAWDYKVVVSGAETGEGVTACTFEVVFNQTYLDTITGTANTPTTIVVSYSATVNENAVIDGDGNKNSTYLKYGDDTNTDSDGADDAGKTTGSTTTTYVYDVDILKYTAGENDAKTPLSGAEFVLYKTVKESTEEDPDNEVTYYAVLDSVNDTEDASKVVGYRLTGWTTTESEATTLISGEDGTISVDGLDVDTYYLEETKAPNGYNLLDAAVKIVIDDKGDVYVDDSDTAATNGLVEVENKTGTELPSTGGIGTTIFYVVGSILVVGAVVLLITKRRMNGGQD